jgi:type II secretory pathway pseudopilin PulG
MKKIISQKNRAFSNKPTLRSGKKSAGFSLIEVVISVFLVAVGLVSSVQLISSGIYTSLDSRDQMIAAELAQEGVELVRNIRDNNWLNEGNGGSFTYFPNNRQNCRIDKNYDYDVTPNIGCHINDDKRLYLENNFYVHNSTNTTSTKFHRRLDISDSSANRELKVYVYWGADLDNGADPDCKLSNKCVSAKTILTTWGEPAI